MINRQITMQKILKIFKDTLGITCIRALFDADDHTIVSKRGWKISNNLNSKEINNDQSKRRQRY